MRKKHILKILCISLFVSFGSNIMAQFSYEILNGKKHFNITRENIINLYNMPVNEMDKLLLELHYKKEQKGNKDVSYTQKSDTVSGVFQIIKLRHTPQKVIDIIWVSLDEKDRFQEFEMEVKKHNDIYIPKKKAYLIKRNNKEYLVMIKDIIVGKQLSIIGMDQ